MPEFGISIVIIYLLFSTASWISEKIHKHTPKNNSSELDNELSKLLKENQDDTLPLKRTDRNGLYTAWFYQSS
jgi:hypothetical protein